MRPFFCHPVSPALVGALVILDCLVSPHGVSVLFCFATSFSESAGGGLLGTFFIVVVLMSAHCFQYFSLIHPPQPPPLKFPESPCILAPKESPSSENLCRVMGFIRDIFTQADSLSCSCSHLSVPSPPPCIWDGMWDSLF